MIWGFQQTFRLKYQTRGWILTDHNLVESCAANFVCFGRVSFPESFANVDVTISRAYYFRPAPVNIVF